VVEELSKKQLMKRRIFMKKNLLSIILIVALLGSMLLITSCGVKTGNENNNDNNTAGPAAQQNTDNDNKSEEPIEISYICFIDLAGPDSYVTKKLPELLMDKGFNVKFKIIPMGTHDGTEWGNKFKMMIASGEQPPDIVQDGSLRPEPLKAGWYAELNMDFLKNVIPEYVEQVEQIFPGMWAWGKDPDTGKLYGIPSYNMFGPNRHTFVYRGDWLEKLGFEKAPETLEEFETSLRAVRQNDPNGNGQKDEFGYTAGTDQPGVGFSEIFAAYGVMPGQWMLKDGKVVRGEVQPEAKEALALLRKWYQEDLLPKGILTTANAEADFYADVIGTLGTAKGYAPALVPTGMIAVNISKIPGAKLVMAPGPKGPNGQYGTWEWGPRKYVLSFGKHLEKDQEKMEMILKIFDTIASDKTLFELTMLGERGVHWEFVDKEANKGGTIFLEPYTEFNKRLDEVGVREMSESALCPIWYEKVYKDYLDPRAVEYASQNPGMWDVLLGITTAADLEYGADLTNLTKSTYLEIITGKQPLDAFDEYVQKWYDNGGQKMTEEANALYEKSFK